jgi:hypothetical protein
MVPVPQSEDLHCEKVSSHQHREVSPNEFRPRAGEGPMSQAAQILVGPFAMSDVPCSAAALHREQSRLVRKPPPGFSLSFENSRSAALGVIPVSRTVPKWRPSLSVCLETRASAASMLCAFALDAPCTSGFLCRPRPSNRRCPKRLQSRDFCCPFAKHRCGFRTWSQRSLASA